jgi:glycosyltransferase involved in cell wall biosynthesis
MPTLSVTIITFNEERNIGACLESVKWADEIIIVDSGSSDQTIPICQQYTSNITITDWPGFGVQKNRAVDKASGDWILSIDADERVPQPLQAQILERINRPDSVGYEIPRRSYFCGKAIHHSGWWPDYTLRLFKRGAGKFSDRAVHERLMVEGKTEKLTTPLEHITYRDLQTALEKSNHYSTLGAEILHKEQKKSSLTLAVLKGLYAFIRTYFIQAGFLDGKVNLPPIVGQKTGENKTISCVVFM